VRARTPHFARLIGALHSMSSVNGPWVPKKGGKAKPLSAKVSIARMSMNNSGQRLSGCVFATRSVNIRSCSTRGSRYRLRSPFLRSRAGGRGGSAWKRLIGLNVSVLWRLSFQSSNSIRGFALCR
jgi:hypothetical protein